MIFVDPPVWRARGRVWSHLASDTGYDELHAFAERVGLHPFTYDGDHYDVPEEHYDAVVAAGAVPTTAREILARVRAAGLRFPKRRGERPVAALPDGLPYLTVPHRLDLVLSDRLPPEASTVAAVTFVTDTDGRLLLVRAGHRDAWEGPGGWREAGEPVPECAARELREETGLAVEAGDLAPCAYERIICHEPVTSGAGAGRLQPTSHIAVFRAEVGGDGDALTGRTGPEGQALQWLGGPQLEECCGALPWWPILARLFLAESSQSRRPRSVR